jgi:hypothetical protein
MVRVSVRVGASVSIRVRFGVRLFCPMQSDVARCSFDAVNRKTLPDSKPEVQLSPVRVKQFGASYCNCNILVNATNFDTFTHQIANS